MGRQLKIWPKQRVLAPAVPYLYVEARNEWQEAATLRLNKTVLKNRRSDSDTVSDLTDPGIDPSSCVLAFVDVCTKRVAIKATTGASR